MIPQLQYSLLCVATLFVLSGCAAMAPKDLKTEIGTVMEITETEAPPEPQPVYTGYSGTANAGANAAARVAMYDTARGSRKAYRVVLQLKNGKRLVYPDSSLGPMRTTPQPIGKCYSVTYSEENKAYVRLVPSACE